MNIKLDNTLKAKAFKIRSINYKCELSLKVKKKKKQKNFFFSLKAFF